MVIGSGKTDRPLSASEVREIVERSVATLDPRWRRILVLIPDGTRTMPLPLIVDLLDETLGRRIDALDYLVALGTHRPMTDEELGRLIGRPVVGGRAGSSRVFNHRGIGSRELAQLGTIPAAEIASITGGLLSEDLPVRLNRLVLEYDALLVCGPVFPHEVVGFSGGNKYFFPGIAGPEVINLTHWLGALISSYEVIGAGYTPVRAVIDRAASLIDRPKICFAAVVDRTPASRVSTSASRTRRGRRPRRSLRGCTSSGSRNRSVACSRSCRRCTRISGPPPRGCTRWSPPSPTAARWSSTRRTSPRSATRTVRQSRRSATTAGTTSWPSGNASSTSRAACSPTPPTSRASAATTPPRAWRPPASG